MPTITSAAAAAARGHVTGLAVALLLVTGAAGCTQSADSVAEAQDVFAQRLAVLEARVGGQIGAYALDTGSGNALAWRADERFAMASTFKPLLVAAILAGVDAGRLSLDAEFTADGVEVQPYSPVIEALADDETLTLAGLCEAAITLGDNTVTNMLLQELGGPDALTRFLREHGDGTTRLDRYETALNENAPGDERDTSTPAAMAHSYAHFLIGEALGSDSRRQLQDWLVASRTGFTRLRAGLPDDWRSGDKTGTGGNGAVNNVAVTWPPGGAPVLIAVYMSWSEADTDALNPVHAEIAASVVELLPALRGAGD